MQQCSLVAFINLTSSSSISYLSLLQISLWGEIGGDWWGKLLVTSLALSVSSAWAVVSFCRLRYQQGWCYRMFSLWRQAGRQMTWQWPRAEFNASVNWCFHFICEFSKGWGEGVRGIIRRLMHELVINTLTLRRRCFVSVASRLLFVRVHHLWPDRWVLQAETKIAQKYFNSSQQDWTHFTFTCIDLAQNEVNLLNELIPNCFTLIVEGKDDPFGLVG